MMNQLKFYKLAVWGLLLLNFFILTFFLFNKPKHRPPHDHPSNDFKQEVITILNLNDQQKSTFNKLAEKHKDDN